MPIKRIFLNSYFYLAVIQELSTPIFIEIIHHCLIVTTSSITIQPNNNSILIGIKGMTPCTVTILDCSPIGLAGKTFFCDKDNNAMLFDCSMRLRLHMRQPYLQSD